MINESRSSAVRRQLALGVGVSVLTLSACATNARIPVTVSLPTTAASSSTPGPAVPGRSSGGRDYLVSVGGEQRSFRLHIPLTGPAGPRPLVIALHSGGSSPQTMEYSVGLDSVADRLGLIVAYPEAVGGYWNNGREHSVEKSGRLDDTAFLAAVLADVRKRQQVDKDRIVMIGQGDGGVMAMNFAGRRQDVLSGIAVVSGQMVNSNDFRAPTHPISALFVHGTADPTFQWAGTSDAKVGLLKSVRATTDYFVKLNGFSGAGTTKALPDRDPLDGTTVSKTLWSGGNSYSVTLFTVRDGGFPWPGGSVTSRSLATKGRTSRDLDTSAVIGHFALDVRRPKTATPSATTAGG